MRKRDWIHLLIILVLLGFGYFRYRQKTYQLTRSQIIMDTQVEISITSKDRNVNKVMDGVFQTIKMYEEKFSYFDVNSDLSIINNSKKVVKIDKEFYEIFSIAKDLYENSDSLYDISIGRLTDLWDFNKAIVPKNDSIIEAQKYIGFDKITFSKDSLTKPEAVKINLGSISKGYIVDRVYEYLIKHKVIEGYVNAGGNIRVFSQSKDPVRIGIRHPRIPGDIIATIEINNQSIATSGDYERYFEQDGIRYHHIINPKTGYPDRKNISVTVIAKDAVTADVLSTTLFLMNPEKGIDLLKKYPGSEAIIYYFNENNEIIALKSEGMKKYLVSEK